MRLFKRGVDMTSIVVLSLALVVYVVVYGIIVAKCIKNRGDNMYTIALLLYAYVILGFIDKKVKK